MEEVVSNREYTCSFIKQDDLAYVAKIRRWETQKREPSNAYARNQFIAMLKRNFDLKVERDQVKVKIVVLEEKSQGKLNKTQRRRWHNMHFEWMSVVKKTVVVEELSPKHKSGWITIDPDEE
jgi:hypothetical protein|tara:strand:- start:267 stop:632 length:366 start_codon:yes stop_codon:yes gene_type:complete